MPFIGTVYHAPVTFETNDVPRLAIPHIKVCPNDRDLLRAVQTEFGTFGHYTGTGVRMLSQETCVIDCSEWASSPTIIEARTNYKLHSTGLAAPSKNCSVSIDSRKFRRTDLGALSTALENNPLIVNPTTPTPGTWWQSSNWDNGLTPIQFMTSLRTVASEYDNYFGHKNSLYLMVDEFHIAGVDRLNFYWSYINYLTFFRTSVRDEVFLVGDTSCINSGAYNEIEGMPLKTDIYQSSLRYTSVAHACHSVLQSFSNDELKLGNDGYIYFSPVLARTPGQQTSVNTYLPRYIALRLSLVATKESTPYSGSWA